MTLDEAIRHVIQSAAPVPGLVHVLEQHSLGCQAHLTEDRADCSCLPSISIHAGEYADCGVCNVRRH